MYSRNFPTTSGQIYEEVRMGVEQVSPKAKMNIFRPIAIKDMEYYPGCHEAFPQGKVRINAESGIKTLHMRNLSKDFIIDRNLRARKRNSEINRANGWGVHVDWPKEEWIRRYEEGLQEATNIL